MREEEGSRVAWALGVWLALSLIEVLRFYCSAYSESQLVFLFDLLLPKAFFLFVAIAFLVEGGRSSIRYLLFLTSVLFASTLPQLWAPFWFAIGILGAASLLAGLAFFMELVSGSEKE